MKVDVENFYFAVIKQNKSLYNNKYLKERKNMRKVFEKYETLFCMLLIVLYILINLLCIKNFGMVDYRSAIINTIFSIFI